MRRPHFLRQAAGLALAVSMQGAALAYPKTVPSLPLPKHVFAGETGRKRRRKQRRDALVRAARREQNERNRQHNLLRRLSWRDRREDERGVQAIVNKMTNWERNQWARAGYPKKGKAFKAFAAAAIRRLEREQKRSA